MAVAEAVRGVLAIAAAVAALVATGSAGTTTSPPFCKGSQLIGKFTAVLGSAGAGNIVYRLRVINVSDGACFVSGLPVVRLIGAGGKALPTHVTAARPGIGTAARIVLAHADSAKADARFSPDVPGPGEPVLKRQCEPTAYTLRVTAPGGGAFGAPIRPPTPVCEHGALSFSLFSAAG